jgi:serine/threonine protein kinase
MLNSSGIVHFDLKIPNILFEVKTKNPIIIDFGLSLSMDDLGPKTYSKYFYTYNAAYYVWPVDVHIINYVINVNSNLTYEELVILVDTNIKTNTALSIFSEGFVKRYRDLMINAYKKYTNVPVENVVTELVKNCNTWDIYSLSVMFLQLVHFMSYDGFTDNKLIKEFSELLLLNIHPNAARRLSFDETKKRYKKLFSLDVSVDGYESLLNNFDKKIFVNKAIKESMQQEKLTPDVLKK